MRHYDLSPLFRSNVGYERLNSLFDAAFHNNDAEKYPPYNIEKRGEDHYRITMAVAGFEADQLDITYQTNQLIIQGTQADSEEKNASPSEYLHRGIASRAFQHKFGLADHIKVADARLENGLLHIDLVREVPEALKPQKVAIGTKASQSLAPKAA